MILAHQQLIDISTGKSPMICSSSGKISSDQIQMASVDSILGDRIYRMKSAALPRRGESVMELIEKYSAFDFEIKKGGSYLERNACYIIPLRENLKLSKEMLISFSPKSSIGRTDTFVRALSDNASQYDMTKFGYCGNLYLGVIPLSFNMIIRPDLSLTQFRVMSEGNLLTNEELVILHSKYGVLYTKDKKPVSQKDLDMCNSSFFFHIDLERTIVGFESKTNPTEALDLSKVNHHDPYDFWIPIKRPKNREIILTPGKFYLLATRERVKVPNECCAEVVAYDVSAGEWRTHYAGFFDNGFGGEGGTPVVLEVRAQGVPERLYDGQRICRMVFEKTAEVPKKLYGKDADSNYIGGRASLSKHFKDKEEVWEE